MKLLNVIENWTLNDVLLGWFVAWMLHKQLNFPYHLKKMLGWSITRYRKFPDCYSCFTFWITLIITFEPMAAIAAYLISIIIEKE
jgi:hypothetical protein